MGKVPALRHGDTVITEVAAICTYLADEFPAAKLNVPIGTPRRGIYLKWLFFGPSCIEPAVTDRAAPRKEEARRSMLGYGDFDTTMNVVAAAVAKGPWLMGEQFTAADVVLGANIRWGTMFKMIPERPEFSAYAARIAARPAAQRADAKDKEMAAQPVSRLRGRSEAVCHPGAERWECLSRCGAERWTIRAYGFRGLARMLTMFHE